MSSVSSASSPHRPSLDEVASRPSAASPPAKTTYVPPPMPDPGPMLYGRPDLAATSAAPAPPPPASSAAPGPLPCPMCDKFKVALLFDREAAPNLSGATYTFEDGRGMYEPWSDCEGQGMLTFTVPIADLQDRYLAASR